MLLVIALFSAARVMAGPMQDLAAIEHTVRHFIAAEGMLDADTKAHIGRLDPRLRLAACDRALESRFVHARRASGPVSIEVRCNGSKPWSLYVPVTIERYAQVVVTTRPIARGRRIERSDLTLERRRVDTINSDFLGTMPDTGLVAVRQMGAGQVVRNRYLERPNLVRRGQDVVLTSGHGGVSVRVKGRAMADGSAGERIRVRNLGSDRVVEGTISSNGAIIVAPGSMM